MQGETSKVPTTQQVQAEVREISQSPQGPSTNSLIPPKSTPPSNPAPPKKQKSKKVIIVLILLIVLIILGYAGFLSFTYWNCSKITPRTCETNSKCNFSLSGFTRTSDMEDNCCGNNVCEEGSETSSSCPNDCPNCDDSSRLTEDSFNYQTQKCENIATHYFIEDFEEGETSIDKKVNWKIIDDQGNKVLDCPGKEINGVENDWANFGREDWVGYESELSFKLVENYEGFGFHFYAIGQEGYIIDIRRGGITLRKENSQGRSDLSSEPFDFKLDQWHELKIEKEEDSIKVYLDDTTFLEYTDDQPLSAGRLRLETFGNGHVMLDDISIAK